eukprot:6198176-Pleurochrysis_carterae.AAC.1
MPLNLQMTAWRCTTGSRNWRREVEAKVQLLLITHHGQLADATRLRQKSPYSGDRKCFVFPMRAETPSAHVYSFLTGFNRPRASKCQNDRAGVRASVINPAPQPAKRHRKTGTR